VSPGHRRSGARRQTTMARYVGPALKVVDPAAWADLGQVLDGRTLDVVSIFTEPPATRVVIGFGALPGRQEPGPIALALDCVGDTMAIAVTPSGFDALQHVDFTPIQADPAEEQVGGGARFPSFTVDDEDSDQPLDADAFTAAVSRRIGRLVLARVRISGAAESPTAAFVFENPPGPAVVLRVRAGGGSAWLDLRNPQGGGSR
jgi:hypothetical protein